VAAGASGCADEGDADGIVQTGDSQFSMRVFDKHRGTDLPHSLSPHWAMLVKLAGDPRQCFTPLDQVRSAHQLGCGRPGLLVQLAESRLWSPPSVPFAPGRAFSRLLA
jgi:hypothetical protein